MSESPLKRSLKFVASAQNGMPVKRRQVQQACEPCRKKKKRCSHGTGATEIPFLVDDKHGPIHNQPSEASEQEQPISREPAPRRHPPSSTEPLEQNGHGGPSSTDQDVSTSRFVGDLSPESILIEATSKIARNSYRYRAPSDIGTWLPRSSRLSGDNCSRDTQSGQTIKDGAAAGCDGPVSLHTLSGHLSSPRGGALAADTTTRSRAQELSVYPPEHDYQQLYGIYLEHIHPMLPVLTEVDVHESRRPKTIRHAVFGQVIALAAAVEPSALKHLRLEPNGPLLLSFQHFHQVLSKAIFASLDANALIDRVDHIRVLLLMFFFYQPVRASERDLPSLIFSQAVHYAQSLGVHLLGYSGPEEDTGSKDAEGLFCALWALDRINAAFNGRPCLLHERDTDRDIDKCIAAQEQPAFRLFMGVAMMLDRVIWLYRPCSKGDEAVELPVFESMIIDAGAEKLPPRLHATLEIFYHAISVLSCRQPSSAFAPFAPAQAHLPHPSLNARRSLSADRIVDLVSSSLSSPSSPDSISNLPFVPYAVSLSLSVSYRKMRYSKIPMYRMRGKARFEEVVALLQVLGEVYTCARVNAGMGEAILREMDKTARELAGSSGVGAVPGGGGGCGASSPLEVRPGSRRKTATTRKRDTQGQGATSVTPGPSPSQPGETPLHIPPVSTSQHTRTPEFALPPSAPNEVATGRQQVDELDVLQPSFLGDLLDIDLFGHFDPGFDLNAVDAALEANLDMGFPQTWTAQWPD